MIVLSFKHLYFSGLRIILYYGCLCFSVCQEAVMVDCLCVWLYCTLGVEQLCKATVLLGCKLELGENYCVEGCRSMLTTKNHTLPYFHTHSTHTSVTPLILDLSDG